MQVKKEHRDLDKMTGNILKCKMYKNRRKYLDCAAVEKMIQYYHSIVSISLSC